MMDKAFKIFTVLALAFLIGGACATVKKVVRTVNDLATDLCWIVAEENTDELGGLTPAAWCAIKENLDPFINQILEAQRLAGQKTGLTKDTDAKE